MLLLLVVSKSLYAQNITGVILNVKKEKIAFANIVVKDSMNAPGIKEFTIAQNGYYSITLEKTYKSLVLEVTSGNYLKAVFVIDSFISTNFYHHDFILIKDTVTKLQEVVVLAKARPFQIKGDTVSYNVSAYRAGNERKIEDIIKKLPGIEVNQKNGEITYKGKSIETVKLDGEDLFASNYSIGTRNINVEMVEQVQAIENYSDNPLLKGIESGDKVALNLILKKKKTDHSGSVDLGLGSLGNNTSIDASTNLLGISKKYKSFATASYNNIGINNTPFDYFSYNPSVEQIKEADLLAIKYIPDTYLETKIDPNRSNINNSFFGCYNAVFKLLKKISLRSNVYFLKDKLTFRQSDISTNNINGQVFTTSDRNLILKRPIQIRGDAEIKYNLNHKSLLEYYIRRGRERISTSNEVLQNNASLFNTSLSTINDYFKQALVYTVKFSEKNAFQFYATHTISDAPQDLLFIPAIFEPQNYTTNNQISKFTKRNLQLQSTIIGSRKNAKYSFLIGSSFKNIGYSSDLIGYNNNSLPINGHQNDLNYLQKSTYINSNYKFRLRRFSITPAFNLTYLNQKINDKHLNNISDTIYFLIEPTFSIGYKLNNYSAFLISAGIRQKPFSEEFFIKNPVYISNRLIKENNLSLQIQQSRSIATFYLINNLYKQFQLNIGANYSVNKGNYFSNLQIQQNSTRVVYFFLPENNRLLSVNFMIEKYVPYLQGTFRFKSDYSHLLYKNIINNSLLRDNSILNFNSSLFFKTAFDGKINFENTIQLKFLQSKTNGASQFSNQSLSNNFQIIIKPTKKVFLLFSTDYYLPTSLKNNQDYFFFDTDLTYQTKNKIYDFRFKARNITNNKTLNLIDINDYSKNNLQTNLLPGLFIVSVSRNF